MEYKETGTIIQINPVQNITDTFQKRSFVIEQTENPKYPQYYEFELAGKVLNAIDGFKVGQAVAVNFNLRGRKYLKQATGETMYFMSMSAWKIDSAGEPPQDQPHQNYSTAPSSDDLVESDVPF